MTIATAASFFEALRDGRILDSAQLEEIHRDLQNRFPEPRALAGELLRRGWLTAFQVNQILQGRAGELLLGPYLLLERLGEGGMGQVFKARHLLMDRIVALKVIRKERLAHDDAVQRFHREIRMAAQLNHPHIVQAHEAGLVGATHFLVMEYAEGIDLARLVQKSGPLPVARACGYVRQAAAGLQHVFERSLVHRDIKPSNLQVTAQGTLVKILDMGLACAQAADGPPVGAPELTQQRMVMGTPDYMAPEQIADSRRVDIRADIYSLGCTLYFLLAGRPPFPSGGWEEKLACHVNVTPPPIGQIRPDVPPALAAILSQMLAKRAEDRYPVPAAVVEALAPFCPNDSTPRLPLAAPLPTTISAPRSTDSPSTLGSNADPAATKETGWTQQPQSTVVPPPLVVPTVVPQTVAAHPNQGAQRRWWLLASGGAGLGIILLLIFLWPRSDGAGKVDPDRKGIKGPATAEDGKLFIDEDFSKKLPPGQPLPDKWESKTKGYAVIADQDGRPCLEIIQKSGQHTLTLPPLNLSGNFFIEGDFQPQGPGNSLTIRLEPRKGDAKILVAIATNYFNAPQVTIANQLAKTTPDSATGKWRFRVVRDGGKLDVFLNNEKTPFQRPLAVSPHDKDAEYTTVEIELSAGAANRLYRLKVGQLPP